MVGAERSRNVVRSPRRPRVGLVERPRLVSVLDGVPPGGVGLIVAPAGSGKSVLVRQWVEQLEAGTVAHVELGPTSDDPIVLARELVRAVAGVAPDFDAGVSALVSAAGQQLGRVFLARFLVELEQLDREIVLVVDDAHLITSGEAMSGDLRHLVEELPDNVRIVLAARWDPSFGVHALRLQGRVVDLRATDVAFDSDEARAFIAALSAIELDDEQLGLLLERTDGWVAGLQLAAISLQRTADVSGFIEHFRGSDTLVADYLTEEVLADLEPELSRFLLRTSVLPWLSADLCAAVSDEIDIAAADEILDFLVHKSFFVMPLDPHGRRLRYHRLFADLLLYKLRHEDPDAEVPLRQQASTWLVERGHVVEAIDQLVAARDATGVVRLVRERGQGFFERSEAATLVRWLSAARDGAARPAADLEVDLLAAQVAAFDTEAATETYRRLERRSDLSLGEQACAQACYACLGLAGLAPGEVERAAGVALELLPALDDSDLVDFLGIGGRDSVELISSFMTGVAAFHRGDLAIAAERLEAVLALKGVRYAVWKTYALGELALVRAWTGRVTEARSLALSAVETAEHGAVAQHVGLAYAHHALALAALAQLDLGEAAFHLHESGMRAERSQRAASLGIQRLLSMTRAHLGEGPDRGLAVGHDSPQVALEPQVTAWASRALHARLLVATGKVRAARDLLVTQARVPALAAARVDVALGLRDLAAARDELERWDPEPGDLCSVLGHVLRRVALLAVEGHRAAALDVLGDGLERAETEELRSLFLEVPAAISLLRSDTRLRSQPFAASVLEGARRARGRAASGTALVQPMTEREREILDYLPSRLSNSEIAAALYVSVNTLKTHLRHIYMKLDVADRDSAVARAAEAGIL